MSKTLFQEFRQVHLCSTSKKIDKSFDQYIKFLSQKGLKIKNSLFSSYFQLQNGLVYSGIATKQPIRENQQLVRVLKQLLLSSFEALQCKQLKHIYEQQFYHHQKSWENRVICTFSLFLYQKKDQKDIWYQMINHLPKEIDTLCFWSLEQLNQFKDLTVKRAALKDLQLFQNQWKEFEEVQKKYQILKSKAFTKENYRWIYIHLSSRTFGKYLQFVSLVPYCQFFNHHCSKVYYTVDSVQVNKKQNQIQNEIQKQKIKSSNQKCDEQLECLSSQGSDESQDYFQEGQFDYNNIEQCFPLKQQQKQCPDLCFQEQKNIKYLADSLLQSIYQKVKLVDFSILIVGQFSQKVKTIYQEYLSGKEHYDQSLIKLKEVQKCLQKYLENIIDYYQSKGKIYDQLDLKIQTKQISNLKKNEKQNKQFIQFPKQIKKPFNNLLLLSGKKDKFEANNQVYFRYGKDSNRTLLLWYGFALLGNKYEHVWINLDIVSKINMFSDVLKIIQTKNLSLKRKFKICHNRLNFDIIMFLRLKNWHLKSIQSINELFKQIIVPLQKQVIQELKEVYLNKIEQYKGDYDLSNLNLSYHEYFIEIYHIQKINILKQQIQYLDQIMIGLQNKEKGQSKQQSFSHLTAKQATIFQNYRKMI